MTGMAGVADSAASRYTALRPHLDERQRRLLLGVEAQRLGRGGIKAIAAATGVHPDTIARGVRELDGLPEPVARVRAPGGGRKKLTESDPELMAELKALVDPQTRGDPMSPLVWTTKSTRNLAGALTAAGHRVSDRTVARMLVAMGFSLQANAKVIEGRQHEDRDAQFDHLSRCVGEHIAAGQPVISVDTKKKELVGEFKNGGREYQPKGSPVPTNVHDFMDQADHPRHGRRGRGGCRAGPLPAGPGRTGCGRRRGGGGVALPAGRPARGQPAMTGGPPSADTDAFVAAGRCSARRCTGLTAPRPPPSITPNWRPSCRARAVSCCGSCSRTAWTCAHTANAPAPRWSAPMLWCVPGSSPATPAR